AVVGWRRDAAVSAAGRAFRARRRSGRARQLAQPPAVLGIGRRGAASRGLERDTTAREELLAPRIDRARQMMRDITGGTIDELIDDLIRPARAPRPRVAGGVEDEVRAADERLAQK